MKLSTQQQIDAAERTLRLVWVIVAGAVLYSVLTVTPLVQRVTSDEWDWTAPILPLVVDAAVIIVVRVGAIVARLDGEAGAWPVVLRWLTGAMTLALNVGDSMLSGDWVGVGVHAVAPILLIVTAEAALMWRRAITRAVARIQRERAVERDRVARERREEEERSRAEREAREMARADERERDRQAEERRREQERADRAHEREHAAQLAREERDHAAQMEREREERAAAREEAARLAAAEEKRQERERVDRLRRDEQQRLDREHAAREAAQKTERDRKATDARRSVPAPVSAAVSTPRPAVSATVSTPAHDVAEPAPQPAPTDGKMSERDARAAVVSAVREGRSQRATAALTGWSTGWIAARYRELEQVPGQLEMSA
ncbi:hypothetical protein OHA84_38680 [Streptomyces sp. NBC_00513]|uniref:hypothetical protein n=1 Tax=unclassified Streptomyces TaxID=2593676 RepID=UPI00225C126F|nr:hypothetical protein [Streptomyces sp. NBC_00424]MCX5079375.1 hypothetical protein [Streptomyces sp. NBC_00424]MCX5079385.1 hypothetical protein [Streptomyces sp. NBC_00424]WUD46457.1 hypothetical protein OHA84_38730 [Streptomyces sp. NBC_00513]WUD46467.1 hypothetical protein OHA84_38680 [Streptomyces sp. NBC_00513]